MNLHTYLQYYGVSLPDVVAAIQSRIHLDDVGESIFLSGSLVEGIGNLRSDIDAFLLSDRGLPEHLACPIIIQNGDWWIDVECWNYSTIEALVSRLNAYFAHRAQDLGPAVGFSEAELQLLHRLWIGIPIREEERFLRLRKSINPRAMSKLLLDRAVVKISGAQLDIVGLFEDGQPESALFLSQKLLWLIADALLAALGNTNPSEKWRLLKLRAITPITFAQQFPGCLLDEPIADVLLSLHSPQSLSSSDLKEHARNCIDLANRLIPWCQRHFNLPAVEDSVIDSGSMAGVAGDSRLPSNCILTPAAEYVISSTVPEHILSAALPPLKLDVQIRWEDEQLQMYRLGDKRKVIVGDLTHVVLLCFNGKTTMRDALKYVSRHTSVSIRELFQALLDMQTFLNSIKFIERTDGEFIRDYGQGIKQAQSSLVVDTDIYT